MSTVIKTSKFETYTNHNRCTQNIKISDKVRLLNTLNVISQRVKCVMLIHYDQLNLLIG